MQPYWTLDPQDVSRLRSPSGDRFTQFVDKLIRAQAYVAGVPQERIATNLRTNIPDGG